MTRRSPAAWAGALAWCALLGWFAFVRSTRVPLLSLADLGFHELGHLVMYIVPVSELLTAAMGSIMQIAVPLGLAAYFWFVRRDHVATVVCAAWAATNFQDVSVYIGDAPHERLELIGGEHDWAYVLGPEQLDRLDQASRIAGTVRGIGLVLALTALACAAYGAYSAYSALSTRASAPAAARSPARDDLFPTTSRTPSSDRDPRSKRW
jgi:hypothetical protein